MKKALGLLVVMVLFGVVSAQALNSTGTSQTEAYANLEVKGKVGDQTSFKLPAATLTLTPNALISGQRFTIRVPVTNTTTYPIVISYGQLPGFPGFADIYGPANNQTVNPGGSYTFDFVVQIGTIPANVQNTPVSATINFSAVGQPGDAGIQGF